MNLVKFLIYGGIGGIVLGELGQVPFGSSFGIHLTDILIFLSLLFFIIWKVISREKITIPQEFFWILGFWLIGIISLLGSLFIFPLTEVIRGGLYLIRFVIYSSTFLIIYNLKISGILKFEHLINLFIGIGIILTGLGLLQLIFLPNFDFLTDFGFDPHQGRLASTFLDPNFTGVFLNLTLGLLIYKYLKDKSDIKNYIYIFLISLGVILTYSRSAYLMLGVFVLGLIIVIGKRLTWKHKIIFISFLISLFLSIVLIFPRFLERIEGAFIIDRSASERFESWNSGWEIFKLNPVSGVGFNNFKVARESLNLLKPYSQDGGHSGSGVDSSMLLVLSTTGILGLILFLLFWINSLKNLKSNKNFFNQILVLLMISLILNSQFINSLFFSPITLWYFCMLGNSKELE